MRVAVVGCGTAGAATALLLVRAGHDVEVLERFEHPEPVGAGLLLQPTGMAVLKRLGLLERVAAGGARIERLHGETAAGREVLDLAYRDLAPGLFGLGVHRGALFGALHDALEAARVPVRTGVEITSLGDPELAAADLVVVANGARCSLRGETPLARRVTCYPWGALWCIVKDPEDAFAGVLGQVYRGTEEMVGFLPTGRSRGGAAGTPMVSMFQSVRTGTPPPRDVAAWRAAVCALAPRAAALVDRVEHPEQVLPAAYYDVRMRAWHHGRSVFLGDAGHAMSPQLGQGANLALIDAASLADCLAQERDRDSALRRYSAVRRAHLRFYARASRLLTPIFQSGGNVLSVPRDALLHPAMRVPWLRRQMLETLAGVKTGVLRATPAERLAGPGD